MLVECELTDKDKTNEIIVGSCVSYRGAATRIGVVTDITMNSRRNEKRFVVRWSDGYLENDLKESKLWYLSATEQNSIPVVRSDTGVDRNTGVDEELQVEEAFFNEQCAFCNGISSFCRIFGSA